MSCDRIGRSMISLKAQFRVYIYVVICICQPMFIIGQQIARLIDRLMTMTGQPIIFKILIDSRLINYIIVIVF